MEPIRYSQTKLVLGGLFCLILMPSLGALCLAGHGLAQLIGIFLIVAGPITALQRLVQLLSNGEAVRYDQRGVTIHTGWRTRSLAWSEVRAIDELTNTRRLYGIIPVSRSHFLRFHLTSGKTIQLPINQLEGTREAVLRQAVRMDEVRLGPANLVDTICQRMGAVPAREPAVAIARTEPERAPVPIQPAPAEVAPEPASGDFDPDAIIARYMVQRAAAPEQAPRPAMAPQAARVAGFGRKGL
ncbi:MAG: hypothetical protein JSS36_12580 [Proteobacteria bacterium]|nr:hypothetical protein [Pseudomonadota bacterium]